MAKKNGKLRMITNNIMQAIYSILLKGFNCSPLGNIFHNIYLQQEQEKKSKYMFTSVSKHAQKRLNERFHFRGYTIEDVKKDILEADKRYIGKNKIITFRGKKGKYIISQSGVLITVI